MMPNYNDPPKYMTTAQLYCYTSLKRPTAETVAEKAGARIKLKDTRRVLYDREKIDEYLRKIAEGGSEE